MDRQETNSQIDLKRLAEVFQILSDTNRLQILKMLYVGERNVGSICRELAMPEAAVSHHLRLLLGNELLKNIAWGKIFFTVLPTL